MQIVEIPLESELNIPNDRIKFIMVHPCLEDKIADAGNGFRFGTQHDRHRHIQLNLIKNTFPLVKNHPSSESTPAHFLIFPELSVTEEGLQKIEEAMQDDWPVNSVVMGGLECISERKFKNLIDNSEIPAEAKRLFEDMTSSIIVNTSFIYIKTANQLRKYYQPKMSASPREQRLQNLYIGNFLLLFKTSSLVFTQIVCFDAIAQLGHELDGFANNLLEKLKNLGTSLRPFRIALLFILQHNDKPNKEDFKRFTKMVLDDTEKLEIDSVIFANSAAQKCGCSEKYGKSRFHFLTPKYQPTDKDTFDPPKTFSFKITDAVKYAQLREDGPCVHSFEYIPPRATSTFSGGDRYPFSNAKMHKLYNNGSIGDGKPIDGLWKKVFDFLPDDLPANDTKNRWTTDHCNQMNIKLKQNFKEIRQELIMDGVPINRLKEITDLLFLGYGEIQSRKRINNPDFWENNYEGEGIIDLVSGLTIFEVLGNVVLQDSCLSKSHTALFSSDDTEFYLTFIDNPNDELGQPRLKSKYAKFLDENATIQWGVIDWTKNTLMLICYGNSNSSDDSIEKYKKYFSTSDSEEESSLPADLISNTKVRFTTLKNCGWLYTYSLDKLRGDLERDCSEIMSQWRRKLEPLRS